VEVLDRSSAAPRESLKALWIVIPIYIVAGEIGLTLAPAESRAAAVWPSAGIALAAVLLVGPKIWPGLFVGAFLVEITATGSSLATALGIACGQTLEGIAGGYLAARFVSGARSFDSPRRTLGVVTLAGGVSAMVGATIGASSLRFGAGAIPHEFWSVWLGWWRGDTAGILIVAPVVVLSLKSSRAAWERIKVLELALCAACALLAGMVLFGEIYPLGSSTYAAGFICFPLLAWPAFRFGRRETAATGLLLAVFAVEGTLRGLGPFAHPDPVDSIVPLQLFLAILILTGLSIAGAVSESREHRTSLIRLADDDFLTGVMTRRRFFADVEHYLAQTRRYGAHGALLFLDLDDFKSVNDTLGHAAGDALLRSVASLLRRRLRDSDSIGRLGGDEFAILLPQTDGARALQLADQLHHAIDSHVTFVGMRPVRITTSIGITLLPADGTNVNELIANADVAMYQAKGAGRNLTRLYDDESQSSLRRAPGLKRGESVRKALDHGLFVLHGQPILDLRRDEIRLYELLVRMVGDDGELVRPATFLSEAERSGAILELDRWVLSRAIEIVTNHSERLDVSVNISEMTLCDPEFLEFIRVEPAITPADPGRLTLEVTPSAISGTERTTSVLRALKALGCRIALDGLGAEFAFLDHDQPVPVDYLKIDGSRPRRPARHAAHDMQSLVDTAHQSGRKTIAKSVENESTLRRLRADGFDYAQGFHIGRPRPLRSLRRELAVTQSRRPQVGTRARKIVTAM